MLTIQNRDMNQSKIRIASTKARICEATKRIENESTNKGCQDLEIVEGKLLEVAKLEGFPSWDFQMMVIRNPMTLGHKETP